MVASDFSICRVSDEDCKMFEVVWCLQEELEKSFPVHVIFLSIHPAIRIHIDTTLLPSD